MMSIDRIGADGVAALVLAARRAMARCAVSIDELVADAERASRSAVATFDEVDEIIADGLAALASAVEWAITGDAP